MYLHPNNGKFSLESGLMLYTELPNESPSIDLIRFLVKDKS